MTALAANSSLIVAREYPAAMRTDYPVEAAVNCFQGAIMVLNSDGFAEPGTTATAKKTIGRCRVPADNTGGANGDITVSVDSGIFGPYTNDDGIAASDVGTLVYIIDDQTVSNANTSQSVAGTVFEVTAAGVFVTMPYPVEPFGA